MHNGVISPPKGPAMPRQQRKLLLRPQGSCHFLVPSLVCFCCLSPFYFLPHLAYLLWSFTCLVFTSGLSLIISLFLSASLPLDFVPPLIPSPVLGKNCLCIPVHSSFPFLHVPLLLLNLPVFLSPIASQQEASQGLFLSPTFPMVSAISLKAVATSGLSLPYWDSTAPQGINVNCLKQPKPAICKQCGAMIRMLDRKL